MQIGVRCNLPGQELGMWATNQIQEALSLLPNIILISRQKAKQFSTYDYEIYDHIFVMDKANYRDVIKLAKTPQEKQKVSLILESIYPGDNKEVPDPYYGGENGFEEVFKMLHKACEKIVSSRAFN